MSVDPKYSLVLYNARIVVPKEARREILVKLHASHQGVERTKRRARQTVFWPSMQNEISNLIFSCDKCQENQKSQQKEPLSQDPLPSRVFEEVAIDFFQCSGRDLLLYTDRLSGWPVIYKFKRD